MTNHSKLFRYALGLLLRRVRMNKAVTQLYLGCCLGVTDSVVSRVESGERPPSLEYLVDFSVQFGIRLSDIIRMCEDDVFPMTKWSEEVDEILHIDPAVKAMLKHDDAAVDWEVDKEIRLRKRYWEETTPYRRPKLWSVLLDYPEIKELKRLREDTRRNVTCINRILRKHK